METCSFRVTPVGIVTSNGKKLTVYCLNALPMSEFSSVTNAMIARLMETYGFTLVPLDAVGSVIELLRCTVADVCMVEYVVIFQEVREPSASINRSTVDTRDWHLFEPAPMNEIILTGSMALVLVKAN